MSETTRRGFMATVGAAAAVLAVPAGAVAAPTGAAGFAAGTWRQAVASWPAAVEAMKAQTEATLAHFRPAYLAEVERLAWENRARFAPGGDLHEALADDGSREEQTALECAEALCSERFGLGVERHGYEEPEGDETLGRMICQISPSRDLWDVDGEWTHICYAARACAGTDVIGVARREGWAVRS